MKAYDIQNLSEKLEIKINYSKETEAEAITLLICKHKFWILADVTLTPNIYFRFLGG